MKLPCRFVLYITITLVFCLHSPVLHAGEGSYVMLEEIDFVVKSTQKATLTVHMKVWVADKSGKSFGVVVVSQDEFSKIKSIKAQIQSPQGKIIRKLKKSEIKETKASPGYVLYSGRIYKSFDLQEASLPYILDYTYKIEYKSLFFWPTWNPQNKIETLKASYSLTVPKGIRYKSRYVGPIEEPSISSGGKTLVWELKNIPPYLDEYYAAPEDQEQYLIDFTAVDFILADSEGSFDSWKSVGAWYHTLAEEQYKLDESCSFSNIYAGLTTDKEKIRTVYKYLQNDTRYVAIELGINGWKPHSAQNVCIYKYGDCKDLSTYFISLLNRIGINAYPALALTRSKGVVHNEFPSNQFNHLITFVPLKRDTLWIDCTSTNATVFDLPAGVEGINVLVVKDGIGNLMKTPISVAEDNVQYFNADVILEPNGTAHIKGTIEGHGNINQRLRGIFITKNTKERKKLVTNWLSEYTPLLKLTSLIFENLDDNEKPMIIRFESIAKKYANVSSRRIFLTPSFYHRTKFDGGKPEERESAVFYNYPFIHVDKISYSLPRGLAIEAIPGSTSSKFPFGEYSHTLKRGENSVSMERVFKINKRRVELEEYDEYYDFMQEAEKADRAKVVLKWE